jgi:hypothetical protein
VTLGAAALLVLAAVFAPAILVGEIFLSCGTDVTERTPVPDTGWTIEARVHSCGATDRGSMRIVAVSRPGGSEVTLAKLNENTDVRFSVVAHDGLVISLPNLVDIAEMQDAFDGIPIRYEFRPENDPNERALYQLWMRSSGDPRAIAWCKKNIAQQMRSGTSYSCR